MAKETKETFISLMDGIMNEIYSISSINKADFNDRINKIKNLDNYPPLKEIQKYLDQVSLIEENLKIQNSQELGVNNIENSEQVEKVRQLKALLEEFQKNASKNEKVEGTKGIYGNDFDRLKELIQKEYHIFVEEKEPIKAIPHATKKDLKRLNLLIKESNKDRVYYSGLAKLKDFIEGKKSIEGKDLNEFISLVKTGPIKNERILNELQGYIERAQGIYGIDLDRLQVSIKNVNEKFRNVKDFKPIVYNPETHELTCFDSFKKSGSKITVNSENIDLINRYLNANIEKKDTSYDNINVLHQRVRYDDLMGKPISGQVVQDTNRLYSLMKSHLEYLDKGLDKAQAQEANKTNKSTQSVTSGDPSNKNRTPKESNTTPIVGGKETTRNNQPISVGSNVLDKLKAMVTGRSNNADKDVKKTQTKIKKHKTSKW